MHEQEKNDIYLKIIIVLFSFLAWGSIKFPVPAFPQLNTVFHTSDSAIKFSITLNYFGFGISQFMWGILSDRYGRRPALLSSLGVACLGILTVIFSHSIYTFVVGWFVEGMGIGSVGALARASLADRFDIPKILPVFVYSSIAVVVAPFIAMVAGGYILLIDWRIIFIAMFVSIAAFLIFCFFRFAETNQSKLPSLQIKIIIENFKIILSSKYFWRYTLIFTLISGYNLAYFASMGYWFVLQFHMSIHLFAWNAFPSVLSFMFGAFLSKYLSKRCTSNVILFAVIVYIILLSIILAGFSLLFKPNIPAIVIFMTLYALAAGVITPFANANLIHYFRANIGILPGLTSGFRAIGTGLIILIAINLSFTHFWPFIVYTLSVGMLTLFSFYIFKE